MAQSPNTTLVPAPQPQAAFVTSSMTLTLVALSLLQRVTNAINGTSDGVTSSVTLGNGIQVLSGAGSPEGVVSAPIGSFYTSTTGGASKTLYVKEAGGLGSSGWVGK